MEKLINNFKISFTKGDTYALAVKFKNIAEDLRTAYFTVKENPDDEPLIQKSLGAGIDKIDDREYKKEKTYKVQLQAIDTENLEANVQYLYDLQVTLDNVVKTVLSGVFVVGHTVTGLTSTTTASLEVAVDDEVETELATTPATNGVEYEQDPVACAKIGDLTALNTTAKETIVGAINEVQATATATEGTVDDIMNGRTSVPLAKTAEEATSTPRVNNLSFEYSDTGYNAYHAGNMTITGKRAIGLNYRYYVSFDFPVSEDETLEVVGRDLEIDVGYEEAFGYYFTLSTFSQHSTYFSINLTVAVKKKIAIPATNAVNAVKAVNATNDADGNEISTTYRKIGSSLVCFDLSDAYAREQGVFHSLSLAGVGANRSIASITLHGSILRGLNATDTTIVGDVTVTMHPYEIEFADDGKTFSKAKISGVGGVSVKGIYNIDIPTMFWGEYQNETLTLSQIDNEDIDGYDFTVAQVVVQLA